MSFAAIEDVAADRRSPNADQGVVRGETAPLRGPTPIILEMMRPVYPRQKVFGQFWTVNDYIDCPPDELFA